ncbi:MULTISPECIES: Maf family protein [Alteromonadaceae]|uniref:Maf family protein n=1 Tax=Alteromonadaceae TaxID=72275 RepID=UPI001C08E179|nr:MULTISPECIES: Maf family protein [Aliiglaciecola]MBU2880195.1 septum formation inhibitor Maf [Aliiglaciecola lipolytica]MDO6713256.1 Maf family protein [Aliiglaciecola sp. 2_MG-2023]MDO6754352.1 Maf family protein [Aliiglaciecola sp. 1_MG-2023]
MLLLASQSPRRKELLSQLGVKFTTLNVDIDETQLANEDSNDYVIRLAIEKAQQGWRQHTQVDGVIGADTIVVVDSGNQEQVLGKPDNFQHARQMWQQLSDRQHKVKTAVALKNHLGTEHFIVETAVRFKLLSEAEMQWYWQTGEPQDKAGAYGIQGFAGNFVKHINGSYSAVVGLPLYETSELIKQAGIKLYEC